MRIATLILALFPVIPLCAQDVPADNDPIVEGEFAAQARYIPWSGSWWPMGKGELGFGWTEKKTYSYNEEKDEFKKESGVLTVDLSPMAKYDLYVTKKYGKNPGAALLELQGDEGQGFSHHVYGKQKKEYEKQGVSFSWWGHCNGWAAASIMEAEPMSAHTTRGVRFEVADLKGLLSESFFGCDAYFTGRRYNKPSNDIERASDEGTRLLKLLDENKPDELAKYKTWFKNAHGRESTLTNAKDFRSALQGYLDSFKKRYTDAYDDPNPAVFHRIITTMIGKRKSALVFDTSADEEVWNFPAWKYTLKIKDTKKTKKINGVDRRVMNVECTLWIVSDGVGENTLGSRSSENNYSYELYCDEQGRAVDGAWTEGSADRHPDFAWAPLANNTGADYEENYKLEYGKIQEILPKFHKTDKESPIEVAVAVDGVVTGSKSQRTGESTLTYGTPVAVTGAKVSLQTKVAANAGIRKIVYWEELIESGGDETITPSRKNLVSLGYSTRSVDFAKDVTLTGKGKKMIVAKAYDSVGRFIAQDEITVDIR